MKEFLKNLAPKYDEVGFFAISTIFFSLFIVDQSFRGFVGSFFVFKLDSWSNVEWLLSMCTLVILVISGMGLSFYHAFSSRNKSLFEKNILIGYMIILQFIIGIYMGFHLLENFYLRGCSWLFLVFPILNIFNAAYLVLGLRAGFINENNISEKEMERPQITLTLLILAIIISLHVSFGWFWLTTISIGMVYVSNINGLLSKFFLEKHK